MKSSLLTLLAMGAIPVLSAAVVEPPVKREVSFRAPLKDAEISLEYTKETAAAYDAFLKASVVTITEVSSKKRQEIPEYIYVLQCVEQGFHEPCIVFGAPPGSCVSYFDFDPVNSTEISDVYNNAVSSISTNTGGVGQFYLYERCNILDDDRGLSVSYNYNLAVAAEGDPRTVEYENQITSWRA